MADDTNRNQEQRLEAAKTVEAYHIEEAVRQAQLARAMLTARLTMRDRGVVEEVRPAGLAGAETQGGTPVLTDEPHETWEEDEMP